MKGFLFWVVLTIGVIAGCSTQPTMTPPSKSETPTASTRSTNIPTAIAPTVPSPAPSLSVTSTPSRTAPNPGIIQTPTPTSALSPQAQATARPGVTTKTYTNPKPGIALDYPSDWTVSESGTGTRFTSPQGTTIDLTWVETQNQSPVDFLVETQLPNTRCLNSTNPHGIAVRNCLDTIAFSYNANLILKLPNNTTRLVSLTMRSKSPNPVFDSMIASARITS